MRTDSVARCIARSMVEIDCLEEDLLEWAYQNHKYSLFAPIYAQVSSARSCVSELGDITSVDLNKVKQFYEEMKKEHP